jgi:hypothetical protein
MSMTRTFIELDVSSVADTLGHWRKSEPYRVGVPPRVIPLKCRFISYLQFNLSLKYS